MVLWILYFFIFAAEGIIFLLYASALFESKHPKYLCVLLAVALYGVLFLLSFFNSMEGKNIQATIQEKDIEDSETISNIYQALKDMYCYGRDSAEIQQDTIRSDEIRTAIEENEHNESVFLRYLTITLSDSTVIDDLKYSAIRGAFYEYNGISYSALDDEVMDEVNNYLGIQNLEND